MKPHVILAGILLVCCAFATAQRQSRSQTNPPSQPTDTGQMPSSQSSPTGTSPEQMATTQVDDQKLQQEVQRQLSTNPALGGVTSQVNNGVVTLQGSVARKNDRDQAKDLAKSVPGVHQVHEKISVSRTQGSRSSGAANAEQANNSAGSLAGNTEHESGVMTAPEPTAGTSNNSAQNSNGSLSAAQQSGNAQSGMAGTTSGMAGDTTTSSQLQSQIQNAIAGNPTMAGTNVSVNVTDSEIDLTGTVNSNDQRQAAYRLASSYGGDRKVLDHVTVAGQTGTQLPPQASQNAPMSNAGRTTDATTNEPPSTPSASPGAMGNPGPDPRNEPGEPQGTNPAPASPPQPPQ